MREFYEAASRVQQIIRHGPSPGTMRKEFVTACQALDGWYKSGCPVFKLSESVVDAIAFTDAPQRYDAPFTYFAIELPYSVPMGDMLVREALVAVWREGEKWMPMAFSADGDLSLAPSVVISHIMSGLCSLLAAGAKKSDGSSRSRHVLPARRSRMPVSVWNIASPMATNIPVGLAKEALRNGSLPRAEYKIGKRFMVRGHWRNQACGKGMKDRRQLWVQPYLKGPDEAEAWARVCTVGKPACP